MVTWTPKKVVYDYKILNKHIDHLTHNGNASVKKCILVLLIPNAVKLNLIIAELRT